MGLSASQSRLLTLTARLSDLELKAQKIQHEKVRLAEQSTEASKLYMSALDAQDLLFNCPEEGKVAGSVENITNSGMYRVADANGNYFYCSQEPTTTSQTFTTSAGNTIRANSDGTMTYSTPFNTVTVNDYGITTTTNCGTIYTDNPTTTNVTEAPLYASPNQNITVEGNSVAKSFEPKENIEKFDREEGSITNISAYQVSKTFTTGEEENAKSYEYSVSKDNSINLPGICNIKKENGAYTVKAVDGNFYSINLTNGTYTSKEDSNPRTLTDDGIGILIFEYTKPSNEGEETQTGSINISIYEDKLVLNIDGKAYIDGVTYEISESGNDGSKIPSTISIYDGKEDIVKDEALPVYNNNDANNTSLIKIGDKYYTTDKNGNVAQTTEKTTINSAIVISIDRENSSKGNYVDTYSTFKTDGEYTSGSKVEYVDIYENEQPTPSGKGLEVTNLANKSTVLATSNGVTMKEPNPEDSTKEMTTRIYKDGDKIIIKEDTSTYTIELNEDEGNTKLNIRDYFVGDDNEVYYYPDRNFVIETIKAGDWVLRNPKDGTFKPVKESNMQDANWLLEQLQSASLYIQKYDIEKDTWNEFSYIASSIFTTEDNDSNVAKAEAIYEAKMAEIQHKDKKLDLELDNVETEHTAVESQIKDVKSTAEKNVERSFNLFS